MASAERSLVVPSKMFTRSRPLILILSSVAMTLSLPRKLSSKSKALDSSVSLASAMDPSSEILARWTPLPRGELPRSERRSETRPFVET